MPGDRFGFRPLHLADKGQQQVDEPPDRLPGCERSDVHMVYIIFTRSLRALASEQMTMASEHVTVFTDDNFQTEVLDSEVPVLVDFWAEWCMPCKMLAPTIEKIGAAYAGKVKVGKMDTDSNRNTAFQYNISTIPTVILFQGGQVKDKLVGLKQENDFRAMLDRALGAS